MQVRVRLATPQDAPILAELRFGFRSELAEPAEPEDLFRDRCARWMADHLDDDPRWRCWVAEGDDGARYGFGERADVFALRPLTAGGA